LDEENGMKLSAKLFIGTLIFMGLAALIHPDYTTSKSAVALAVRLILDGLFLGFITVLLVQLIAKRSGR